MKRYSGIEWHKIGVLPRLVSILVSLVQSCAVTHFFYTEDELTAQGKKVLLCFGSSPHIEYTYLLFMLQTLLQMASFCISHYKILTCPKILL